MQPLITKEESVDLLDKTLNQLVIRDNEFFSGLESQGGNIQKFNVKKYMETQRKVKRIKVLLE